VPHRAHLIVGAGLAASLILAACSPAPAPTATAAQEIVLNARDIAFSPGSLTLRAGAPARLVFLNGGRVEHDVTIPGITVDGKTAEGHGHEEAGHAMARLAAGTVHVSAHAGDRAVVEFTPKAGTYEYACTITGHKEAGMRGTLTVK
jgi:uncharacterized cupredoxin-like copper-binding protein